MGAMWAGPDGVVHHPECFACKPDGCCCDLDCKAANITTMPTADLLASYRDGDEHGWAQEFAFLRREHAARIDMLATSVQERGMATPVLLGNDGRVWDGHHRLCVADMLGLAEVPVTHAA
jgi:hypothetical protein